MAYLGNGIYDLLDVIRASNNPQINYEGLYQDASAPMATSSLLQSMKPGYEFRNDSYMRNAYLNEGDDLSGNISTDYNRRLDFKNYFNNQPLTPTDGVNRFIGFNPRVGIVNAGLPFASTTSEDEEDYLYSGMEDIVYQTPRTIADQNRILGQTFTQQQPNFFQRMLSGASDMYGSGRDLIGTGIGSLMSLASGIPGLGLLMGLINPNPQSAIDTRRLQQAGYGTQLQSIYGPGGIMQGYNPVSMFGRGPLESIINRRNKAKSETAIQKLNQAITDLGGSTDKNLSDYRASRPASERRSTGFGKSGMGRDPDKFK